MLELLKLSRDDLEDGTEVLRYVTPVARGWIIAKLDEHLKSSRRGSKTYDTWAQADPALRAAARARLRVFHHEADRQEDRQRADDP